MADREKVIKGLEEAKEFIRTRSNGSASKICRLMDVCNAAVILLKEQEAVEPEVYYIGQDKYKFYRCPVCKIDWHYKGNYCIGCGRPVLWKGGKVNG